MIQRLVLLILLAVAALGVLACGSEDDDADTDGQVLLALTILDSMDYHAMANAIVGGVVPPDAESKTSRGLAVVRMTEWPTELQDSADATEQALSDLLAELRRPNRTDTLHAGEAAEAVHDIEHGLSSRGWDYLEEQQGVEADGPATFDPD